MSMARRAHAYPQISLTAADLVDTVLVAAPSSITVGDALRLARRRHARVLTCGRAHVLVDDLARAAGLGLHDRPAADVARPLPVVEPGAPELRVRRALAEGAPAVIVSGRAGGAVARGAASRSISLAARIDAGLPVAARAALAEVARLAAAHGARAFLAGGVVRDLWRGETAAAGDLDVVIEGDGPSVARALAAALGGTLVEHERFLTASVESPGHGRIDVVTARTERYERPGALPRVLPGSIGQDLRRRDFTVNAMAIELGSGAFGLLDPLGGVADLGRRRLRILHPLSFVEDPTRMLRAARYGARLGLTADRWTMRCQALALRLAPYPALSPARLAAELERLLAEPSAAAALDLAVRAGVPRLLDPRWRPSRVTGARLAALDAALGWAATHRIASPLTVAALALAAEQPPSVAAALPERLGLTGEPLARVRRALDDGPRLAARVRAAATRSETARALRTAGGAALAALRLLDDPRMQERLDWWLGEGRAVTPALGGDDVIALGVPRGPGVSDVLEALRDARLDGRVVDRQDEIRYVRAARIRDERKG
jgi:tRNA nucleotidyltransferase (CCA-adding enzyme)